MHDHIKKLLDRFYATKDASTRFKPTNLVSLTAIFEEKKYFLSFLYLFSWVVLTHFSAVKKTYHVRLEEDVVSNIYEPDSHCMCTLSCQPYSSVYNYDL